MQEKFLMIWPKSREVTHINYHFSQFGEYITYLEKKFPKQIIYKDGDIQGKCGYNHDKDILELIEKENIKKIVMQITYENAGNAIDLVNKIKEQHPTIEIMAYGTIPKLYPSLLKNEQIDVLASTGHDQKCIESFFKNYNKNNENLKGIKIKNTETNQWIETSQGEYIENYEWTNTPMDLSSAYYEKNNHARYVLNVSTGCPFNCEHCLLQLTEGRTERRRTIESIDKSLSLIEDKYPYIEFFAANLTLDQKYVIDLCKMIKEKHPNITWGCATRIDEVTREKANNDYLLMDDKDLLQIMAACGCTLIGLGVEGVTGNKNSIHTKDFVFEKTHQAIKNIKEAGITAKSMIMVRIPNQTRQDIINTFYYLTKMETFIRPTLYTPYHKIDPNNTDIHELYKYNRKKRPDDNESPVEGISNEQFDLLLKNPSNYIEILNCTEEEIELASSITNTFKGKILVKRK